ncbi:MAG: hypothetical protein ACYC2K_18990, partial [Gemmatimonadales bacterium]
VPALQRVVVDYQPVAGGLAEVKVAVLERPSVLPIWRLAASAAIGVLANREVGLEVASPTGGGELWRGTWRWSTVRPRAAVRAEMPTTFGLPGVLGFEGAWERFADPEPRAGPEASRRAATVDLGAWVTPGLRPSVAARVERWSDGVAHLAVSAGLESATRDDRLIVAVAGERTLALSAAPPYSRARADATFASAYGLDRTTWSARAGIAWASSQAPIGLRPTAGGDLSWAIPLRASESGGALVTGRAIVHAGVAGDQPLFTIGPVVLAAGLFLDGAEVLRSVDGSAGGDRHLDAGGGIRLGLIGGQAGVLRIDLARGLLSDHRSAVTIGVHRSWPSLRAVRGRN